MTDNRSWKRKRVKKKVPKEFFDFFDNICDTLAIKADSQGINSLSEPQRVFLLSWCAEGIIGNGGFKYFYELRSDIYESAGAFDALGFHDAAKACRESAKVFPMGMPPEDQETRWKLIEENEKRYEEAWEKLEPMIWEINSKYDQSLANYVYSHREEFAGLT